MRKYRNNKETKSKNKWNITKLNFKGMSLSLLLTPLGVTSCLFLEALQMWQTWLKKATSAKMATPVELLLCLRSECAERINRWASRSAAVAFWPASTLALWCRERGWSNGCNWDWQCSARVCSSVTVYPMRTRLGRLWRVSWRRQHTALLQRPFYSFVTASRIDLMASSVSRCS